MSFIPYSRQEVSDDDVSAVVRALRSDFLTQGARIPEFETLFALRHEVAHAVSVSSATAGLHIACLALGIGRGSRVWTSPNSFLASANCALYCGATIDFVDIDPATRNMSIERLAEKLELASADRQLPDLVIPVDFAGLPADLREMRLLADRYGFRILEDASHATGAEYLGKPVGSRYADASVFSFHAVKVITTAEGGMVTTNEAGLDRQLRLLRSHGMVRELEQLEHESPGPWYYEQQVLGFNYRMTDVQAALGSSQLLRLDEMQGRRSQLALQYDQLLQDLPVIRPARLPDRASAWHLYAIEIKEESSRQSRAEVFKRMRDAGIGVNVHYIPIHLQPYYARQGFHRGQFPASERYYQRAISLPLFPALTLEQQQRVVATLGEAVR